MEHDTKEPKPNHLLRDKRQRRSWTLEHAANELLKLCEDRPKERMRGDVNGKMLGSWERGEHQPSLYYQKKLCLLYHTSAEELGFIQKRADPPPLHSAKFFPTAAIDLQRESQALPARYQALELLFEEPSELATEELPGAWLALSANDLAALFEGGWTIEDVLT